MHRPAFTIAFLLLLVIAIRPTVAGSLSVRAGAGYDYFSQSYQIDSLVYDTLEATLEFSDTYFDDFKGKMQFDYAPGAWRSMLLSAGFEQSADDFRFKGGFQANLTPGKWRIVSTQQFDTRNDQQATDSINRSYWQGTSRNLIYYSIGSKSKLKGELSGDIVSFSKSSRYSRDYTRLRGKLGYTAGFGAYSSYSIDLFTTYRDVPDSTEWSYANTGTEATIFWLREKGETDILTRWESKDYNQPDNQDDFIRFELQAQNRFVSGNSLTFKQLLEYEAVSFACDTAYNYDYSKFGATILFGYQYLSGSVLIGPMAEWLAEGENQAEETLIGAEDYRELGFRAEADYMSNGLGYYSFQASIGRRALTGTNPIETDFSFTRIDLLLDSPILGGLRSNILLSSEWEYHENESENSRVILFSGSLNYSL